MRLSRLAPAAFMFLTLIAPNQAGSPVPEHQGLEQRILSSFPDVAPLLEGEADYETRSVEVRGRERQMLAPRFETPVPAGEDGPGSGEAMRRAAGRWTTDAALRPWSLKAR